MPGCRAAATAAWAECTRKPVVGRKTKGASTTRVPPPFFLQLRSFVRLPGISPAGKPSPPAPFAASIAGQTRSRGESVTLTPDAPVGPAERHNTVLRTLPPIAVASAHSTAPHARAANEVMLDAHGQRRGEVLGPISDDLLTSRGGSSGEPPPAGCGTYPPARRRRATSRLSFCARPNRRSSARTPHSSVRPTSHGASSSAGRRAGSPRPGWPQPPSAARRSAEPRASPASRRPPGRNSRLPR